jgi:hypothetical protein
MSYYCYRCVFYGFFSAFDEELSMGAWVCHCWKHSELSTQKTAAKRSGSGDV